MNILLEHRKDRGEEFIKDQPILIPLTFSCAKFTFRITWGVEVKEM